MTEIETRFATAARDKLPTESQKHAAKELRKRVLDLAYEIDFAVPDGRWKSLALTALEETLMWANKAIFNQDAVDRENRMKLQNQYGSATSGVDRSGS